MNECWFSLTEGHRLGAYYDSVSVTKKLSVLNK